MVFEDYYRKLLFSLSILSQCYATQVKLGNTTIIGTNTDSVEFFGGIPYAEPPLGDLRLRTPVLKPHLDVPIFNATDFGSPCLQLPAQFESSEDCLKLNIYRPDSSMRRDMALLPVMVFIHGGAFTAGSSAGQDFLNGTRLIYPGTPLVLRSIERGTPILYVSLNYRLGALGWPVGSEAAKRGALNLGSKDQLAALRWVKQNIAAFGGDPTKVTVFGESAGAISIAILYLNSNLESLVRGAILESGSANVGFRFGPLHKQKIWNSFVAAVPECSSASNDNSFGCLRNATSASLLHAFDLATSQANEAFPWNPTIDGPYGVFPELPSKLFRQGRFARIPFISGTNLDEGTLFLVDPTSSSAKALRTALLANLTTKIDGSASFELRTAVDKILRLYPENPALGSPFNTGNESFGLGTQYKRSAAIFGDLWFQSTRRLWTKSAAGAGVKVYSYEFTGPASPVLPPQLGVHHALELFYVFNNTAQIQGDSTAHQELSRRMMDYWISFATSLDPNDGKGDSSRPIWPQYKTSNPSLLQLNADNTTVVLDDYRAASIGFINSNPEIFRH